MLTNCPPTADTLFPWLKQYFDLEELCLSVIRNWSPNVGLYWTYNFFFGNLSNRSSTNEISFDGFDLSKLGFLPDLSLYCHICRCTIHEKTPTPRDSSNHCTIQCMYGDTGWFPFLWGKSCLVLRKVLMQLALAFLSKPFKPKEFIFSNTSRSILVIAVIFLYEC